MKKRILIFASTSSESGITQFILNYLNQLDLQKFEIDIVSFRNQRLQSWAQEHHSQYYELNVSSYRHPLQYKRYLTRIFSSGYDVVHFHVSFLSDLRPYRYAKKCVIPKIIVHSHSTQLDTVSDIKRWIFNHIHHLKRKRIGHYANVLCACSKAAAKWMFGDKKAEEAIILHNAINTDKFAFNPDIRQSIREELGLENDTFVLGHIGRFTYSKNHKFIIRIFEELYRLYPNSVLLLLGEGELQNSIENEVRNSKLDNVRFLGFCLNAEQYYQAMDAFILPSNFEGFPIVGIEAQTAGLPCFFSSSITLEAAITSDCHFLSLETPPAFWARAILESRRVMRHDASNQIKQHGYSQDVLLREIESLYQ